MRPVRHSADLIDVLLAGDRRGDRVTHVERLSSRPARESQWPAWIDDEVRNRMIASGAKLPWSHQAEAAEAAWSGRSVIVSTGTASGKSLAYLMPALSAARRGRTGGATLYLAPTKALAADQLRAIDQLDVPDVIAVPYDGDTPNELRDMARAHATYLLTNPDMLHHSLLPGHHRWAGFLRSLRFVVIDECHEYRGVFGSHVAHVIRRLRRLCEAYGAHPAFILASATTSDPAHSAERLTGLPVGAVTDDGSPRGERSFLLWDPPTDRGRRRNVLSESAELLTDLVIADARAVVFVKSRRAAETVADRARVALREVSGELENQVAAYRAGYLAHERRSLEAALQDGRLTGVAATTALELGVDISGLDVVLIAGWPGTRASLWQQAGRAGRKGSSSVAVLIARDDPLDSYLVQHPDSVFGKPVEVTVLDPANPYVMAPHLCAAAAERPVTKDDLDLFGPGAEQVVAALERERRLRKRGTDSPTWHWTKRDRPAALADLRGSGGGTINLVEQGTGALLGTADAARAHSTVHAGAVYVHQGDTYLVDHLDLDDHVAMLRPESPGYFTTVQDVSSLHVLNEDEFQEWQHARLSFGSVEVTSQVVGFTKRELGSGAVLGSEPLDLPERHLRTRAVWWTMSDHAVAAAGVADPDRAGAAHAAEHAAIGLLPLVATCDRWDVGGLSTVRHADTGTLTVFVHDGHPGGAGFAERGFRVARAWLNATLETIVECPCADGCPSCVQSPKCGNGNEPLDKHGAIRMLGHLLGQ